MTLCGLAFLVCSAARAQSTTSRFADYLVNGTVFALVPTPTAVYIGGQFSRIAPYVGSGVAIDAATGSTLPASARLDQGVVVQAAIADGAGGWFIGGDFGLKRIRPDGSVDSGWTPGAIGGVRALALNGTLLYAGGDFFYDAGSNSRGSLVALKAATGELTAWNPQVYSNVNAVLASGSTVYVGGEFFAVGAESRQYLAAIDSTTGLASAWAPEPDGYVRALAINGSTLYAGGDFANIGGQARGYIAAVDAITGAVPAWHPDADGIVRALAWDGSVLYAGGEFYNIGGQARSKLAALDPATGGATGWAPEPDLGVYSISPAGATIYVAGIFRGVGGQGRSQLAELDAATGNATAWSPNTSGTSSNANTIARSGSGVYAGGNFSALGGVERGGLAALDPQTGAPLAWNPGTNVFLIRDIKLQGSTLYVGGNFMALGGQPRNNLAALDAVTGNATAWNPGANFAVNALEVAGSTVYAAGLFTTISGQARDRIAALDIVTGDARPWNPGADNSVDALLLSGTSVYAGGSFTTLGGQARNRLAALDADTGAVRPWDPNADGQITSLAKSGARLYAGGYFHNIGGQPRDVVAALDANTGAATSWNANAAYSTNILGMHFLDSTLYVGGYAYFPTAQNTAGLDAATGNVVWAPGLYVSAGFGHDATNLYVGGLSLLGVNTFALTRPAVPTGLAGAAMGATSMTWTWNDVAQEGGYRLIAPNDSNVSSDLPYDTTSFTETNLSTNTSYSRRVASFGVAGPSTSTASMRYTLAASPTSFALAQVNSSSITVSWAANGNPAGTSYRAQIWSAGGSTTSAAVTTTSTTFTGLPLGGTYYALVRAVNGEGVQTESSVTLSTVTSTAGGASVGSGGTVAFSLPSGPVTFEIPQGTFPPGVTLAVDVPASVPAASGNDLQALANTAIEIICSAQPSKPVSLTLSYANAGAAGVDPNQLVVARYDDATGTWVQQISQVNPTGMTVVGTVSHFSIFQIMVSKPASDFKAVRVIPNPFRPAQGHVAMGIFNLPPNARVRIYTSAGALIKDLYADAAGQAVWDGTNQSGGKAVSGVYFAYAQGVGRRATFKVAIQR